MNWSEYSKVVLIGGTITKASSAVTDLTLDTFFPISGLTIKSLSLLCIPITCPP